MLHRCRRLHLDKFSFAAHNQDFLASAEGMSMLAMRSTDAHADAARFKAHHIGAYAPFDFGRDAVLPGGGTARVQFSLAFATDPAMPGIAFFTCQQRHPPELFWKPRISASSQRRPARDRGRDVGAGAGGAPQLSSSASRKAQPSLRPGG